MRNALYYGDNLQVLREHMPDESVDLVYLDPPFNSNASYNVLFKERTGEESPAQIKAFTDTWEWTQETEWTFGTDIIQNPKVPSAVKEMIGAFRQFIGQNAMMAYLVMMAPRLVELHRVLKPTGSLYLHCDPTASHYLKILLDTIFGNKGFRNEIVWRRTNAHNNTRYYGRIHDTIFFYAKSDKYHFNCPVRPYNKAYITSMFRHHDSQGVYRHADPTAPETRLGESGEPWQGYNPTRAGRHWAIPAYLREGLERRGESLDNLSSQEKLDLAAKHNLIYFPDRSGGQPQIKRYLSDREGTPLQDIWAYQPYTEGRLWESKEAIDEDVKWLQSGERLSYATQKPEGLIERIINASSNEEDVVLDPFCGCGTAVAAAQKLNRQWIGVDVTHLAVALMKSRLKTAFDLDPVKDYDVVGEPQDEGGAKALWEQDPYQFQYWAVSLLEAQPQQEQKKGADGGIDGLIYFLDGSKRTPRKIVIQVKGGHVSAPQVRDLKGVVEREKAAMGLFITLQPPTAPMSSEAASGGFYHSDLWQRDFPKIQLRTVSEMLEGKGFELPNRPASYQPAQRVRRPEGQQAPNGRLEKRLTFAASLLPLRRRRIVGREQFLPVTLTF